MMYLNTEQAVKYLAEKGYEIKPRTLNEYRHKRQGPCYVKFGKFVRYTTAELDKWFNARFRTITVE